MTQEKLKEWFELSKMNGLFYEDDYITFTIYKGFKILISDSEQYYIRDTRKTNYYSTISKDDLNIIEKLGYIRGVDTISYRLNKSRYNKTKKKIEKFYDRKMKLSTESKKIKTINKMIDININRLFFYRVKIKQFENKYNK